MVYNALHFVCWLEGLHKKLPDGFSQNLDGGWVLAQNSPYWVLLQILDKVQRPKELFSHVL